MSILHPAYEISKISVNEVDWLPAVEDQTLEENVKMNLKDSQIEQIFVKAIISKDDIGVFEDAEG